MEEELYKTRWPRENLSVDCFVHEIMSFRYHWHPDQFELNILLSGQQYCCRGKDIYLLREDDVVLIDPNTGHASYGQTQHTIALVLHFSQKALSQLIPKGTTLSFPACLSAKRDRTAPKFRDIRRIAARMILSLSNGGPYAQYTAKACCESLIACLCQQFEPTVRQALPEVDEDTQQTMRFIMSHLEEHWAEKISLEDVASLVQYNRTYISTLFHKAVGITFYDYLMRVRMQHAIQDLVMTDKGLTDIALSNGFSDLKSFNLRFREMLQCLPSVYRKKILITPESSDYTGRKYIPCTDPFVRQKLQSYL